jgi:amino acid transporter
LGTHKLKNLVIGKGRSLQDSGIFHRISLIAFFAWVGLGADGISSSCYGPSEAFATLVNHHNLAIFVALATTLTIFIITESYSQIVELFPSGGGGYLVASKLLSPGLGMVAGCALLIDYVLTITVSIASGAEALFSYFPLEYQVFLLPCKVLGVGLLLVLNLRGVKESVVILMPIFVAFIVLHLFGITYAIGSHLLNFSSVVQATVADVRLTHSELGLAGMLFLILRAFSMGAGTFTGIEAVSNGMPILREPRVRTAKRTMAYMAASLAALSLGLMLAYLLYQVELQPGKTLNAVLFENVFGAWGDWGQSLLLITLISEAAILLVAAQGGFLDGPRVLANMALDRWMPGRFATLSDRLVTQNGVLLMGTAALVMMILTGGSVRFLVVLYSINVFITFCLSQSGMVRHWWQVRFKERAWLRKLTINGIGLITCTGILVFVIIAKFYEGGWITLVITGGLIAGVLGIHRHYKKTGLLLHKLDDLAHVANLEEPSDAAPVHRKSAPDPHSKTAVLFVNGFNGLGLHTLFSVLRLFPGHFQNFVFIQVGILDAGNFKGAEEIERLKEHVRTEVERYVDYMQKRGFYAESFWSVGIDVADQVMQMAPQIQAKFPHAVFYGGQLVFPEETFFTRLLHNNIVFSLQRKFYLSGIPLVILPIRV